MIQSKRAIFLWKKNPWTSALLAVGMLAAAASAAAGQAAGKKESAGKETYAAVCAGCHGLDGKGGERAPDVATRPRVRKLSDEAILGVLQNGVPNTSMPAFRSLGLEKLRSLVAHLRDLQGMRTMEAIRGNAEHGKEAFFGKGGCGNCHMAQGRGGFYGSDLTAYAQGRSPESIRLAIASPNQELDSRKRIVIATTRNGETFEGIVKNEDNFSMQLLTPDGALHLLYKSSLAKIGYREESAMPADYEKKLSAAELDDLVKFLATVANAQSGQKNRDNGEEE